MDVTLEIILDEMRRGFDTIGRKQDLTNGRVLALERAQDRHDERIKVVERRKVTVGGDEEEPPVERKAITRRDWTVASGSIAIAYAVLKFLGKL